MFSAFVLAIVRAFLIAESLAFSSLVLLKEGPFRLATSNANKPSTIFEPSKIGYTNINVLSGLISLFSVRVFIMYIVFSNFYVLECTSHRHFHLLRNLGCF